MYVVGAQSHRLLSTHNIINTHIMFWLRNKKIRFLLRTFNLRLYNVGPTSFALEMEQNHWGHFVSELARVQLRPAFTTRIQAWSCDMHV